MKKLILILFAFPLFINAQHCKDGTHSEEGPAEIPGAKVDGEVNLNTVSFGKKIKGSPYAFSDWSSGEIISSDNKITKYEKIQIDLEQNRVMVYTNTSKFPTAIPLTNITSVNANDSKKKRNFEFIDASNFANGKENGLFEVCATDNSYLIKQTQKYIHTSEDATNPSTKKSIYKKRTTYFIKNSSGKYVKTKLSKKQLLKLMKDREKEIKNFVSKNKLTYKEKDVPKILKYYHSLS